MGQENGGDKVQQPVTSCHNGEKQGEKGTKTVTISPKKQGAHSYDNFQHKTNQNIEGNGPVGGPDPSVQDQGGPGDLTANIQKSLKNMHPQVSKSLNKQDLTGTAIEVKENKHVECSDENSVNVRQNLDSHVTKCSPPIGREVDTDEKSRLLIGPKSPEIDRRPRWLAKPLMSDKITGHRDKQQPISKYFTLVSKKTSSTSILTTISPPNPSPQPSQNSSQRKRESEASVGAKGKETSQQGRAEAEGMISTNEDKLTVIRGGLEGAQTLTQENRSTQTMTKVYKWTRSSLQYQF